MMFDGCCLMYVVRCLVSVVRGAMPVVCCLKFAASCVGVY